MLFNCALQYTISTVQVNQDDLKMNGTHQFLPYADDVNIVGESIHTVKENAEALVVVSMETGQQVNADKCKYMVKIRMQDEVTIDNSSFERVEEFKYSGTNLTNQNSTQEEIKSRLKSGQMQNILSSSLLIKNLNKIHKIIFLGAVMYRHETWSLTFEGGT